MRGRSLAMLGLALGMAAAAQPHDGEPERRDPIKSRNKAKRERRAAKKKKGK